MQLEGNARTTGTTVITLCEDVEYWENVGRVGFKWEHKVPVLNSKIKAMGLSHEQSVAVVQALFEKFEHAFEGTGVRYDPCTIYITHLLETDLMNWAEV